MMSIAGRLGLPEAVQTALLVLAIVLALSPWFSGVAIGSWTFPKFDPRRRRAMRVIGPIAVALAVALVVPVSTLRPPQTDLRLLAADATADGDIDVAVANQGTSGALLTAIELEVLRERTTAVRPVLFTAATYRLPIGDLTAGQRRRRMVRHLVPAGATERIVIAPESTRAAAVRLTLFAADGSVLSSTVNLPSPIGRGDRR
jgi:hypothetical protein